MAKSSKLRVYLDDGASDDRTEVNRGGADGGVGEERKKRRTWNERREKSEEGEEEGEKQQNEEHNRQFRHYVIRC